MHSKAYRLKVQDMQRHLAQLDAALGKPPRKRSRSYWAAYVAACSQYDAGLRI